MRIIYVEDEPDIRELTCLVLGGMGGHEVLAFGGGREVLDAADALGGMDLLLLDVMMPEIDGRALLGALRGRAPTARVPAIFMTAKTMPGEVEELRRLGAIHVVSKPYDALTLNDELEAALARAA